MRKPASTLLAFMIATALAAPARGADLSESLARLRAVREGKIRTVEGLRAAPAPLEAAAAKTEAPPAPVRVAPPKAEAPLAPEAPAPPRAKPESAPSPAAMSGHGELTLAEAVALAVEGNYSVRLKKKAVELAKLDIRDVTRRLLPGFDFAFTVTKLNEARSMNLPIPGAGRLELSDDNQKNYHFGLSWPIYLFGKLENAERAARSGAEAREAEREGDAVAASFQVKQAFYGILLAERFVAIAEQSLKQIEAHVKTVASQFEVGMASKFDLLRIEVQRANTKPQLIRAKLALKNAKDGFNMILGRSVDTPFVAVGDLVAKTEEPGTVEELTLRALDGRQDLLRAKKDLEAAEYALKEARLGKRPTLAFQTNYNRVIGAALPTDEWDESWNANVVMQVPILDQAAVSVASAKASKNVERARIALEMTENAVRLDVKQAVNELTQARELIVASEKNIEQAEEALNIANVSYENGLNTNLEVMDAQLALDQARTNHTQATHDWLVARAKLDRALGRTGIDAR